MQKSLDLPIGEEGVDWAIEMIEAGFESENLYMLAGHSKPYNSFELGELTNCVLKDLGLDYSNHDSTTKNYVYYLIKESIDRPATYLKTLSELCNICRELNYDERYMNFYFLYYAKDELKLFNVQFYWDGADRNNIDKIIAEQFNNWIIHYELEKATPT